MSGLLAGFGRADITPKLGCKLVGYGNRPDGATGVHDALLARALVLEDDTGTWAIIACDLCYTTIATVRAVQVAVQRRVGIAPDRILIANTHTHAGPHDRHAQNWARPLAEITRVTEEVAAGKSVI